MNNITVLELENISYKYKNDLILNKVNLKINSGEKIALLGKAVQEKLHLYQYLMALSSQLKVRLNYSIKVSRN